MHCTLSVTWVGVNKWLSLHAPHSKTIHEYEIPNWDCMAIVLWGRCTYSGLMIGNMKYR